MNFIRRILGRSPQDSGRASASRHRSHVTPSRTVRPNTPIRESEPRAEPQPEPETEPAYARAAKAPKKPEEIGSSADTVPEPNDEELFALAEDIGSLDSEPDAELETVPAAKPAAKETPVVAPAPKIAPIPQPKPLLKGQRQALAYGIASDIGMIRDNNEDACFGLHWHSITVDDRPDFGFFIVADGMGGHLDGERASGIAVQTLAAEMMARIYVPMLREFKASDTPTILEALVSASEKANLAVIKQVPGGGTTLSALAIVGNLAYLVHVGDSRAYLIHDDRIEQMTTDHTLVQRLIEMKELTPQEAEYYPQKNVLYRAIGQNENLKMERLIRTLPPAAHILICSDGLWDLVDDERLKDVTLEATSPQEACDTLVKLANDRGGSDNISVIILKVPGDSE